MTRTATVMLTFRRLVAVAGLALILTGPASGQSVIGRVLDDVSDAALPFTTVMLLDSAGVAVDVDQSDSTGWFALLPPGPGDYTVFADRLAYDEIMSPVLEIGQGSTFEIELRMTAVPVELQGVTVSTERRRIRLEEEGFYRRRDLGTGYFLDPDEIRDRAPTLTTDLFRQVPGARVRGVPDSYGSTITLRGMGLVRECVPRIVLNGWPMDLGSFTLDELVHPDDIMAVEVYPNAAGAPVRHVGLAGGCGVVMIWTY